MRNDREYEIYRSISGYLKLWYPKIIFHFDYAGMHHTKAQAGKMKAIQGQRGWPDLFIAEPRGRNYHGCYLEIKREGEKLYKKDGVTPINRHIAEQIILLQELYKKSYYADFAIGFAEAKRKIDMYLNLTL